MKLKLVGVMVVSCFCICVIANQAGAKEKELAKQAQKFVREAGSSGMLEVMLGQMAKDKGDSQDVKNFGERMVADHGKVNEELKALAEKKILTIPPNLDPKDQTAVDRLTGLSGGDFDKTYMTVMIRDHLHDIGEFKKARRTVKDPDLAEWVKKTLPVLEEHHRLAEEVARKIGVKKGRIK